MIEHCHVSNQEFSDPYLYPGTQVLINKFNIRDPGELSRIEAVVFQTNKTLPLPKGNLDYNHLKAIHKHFFADVYAWAGEQRTVDIAKGNSYFAHTTYIGNDVDKLFLKLKNDNYLEGLNKKDFCERLSFYFNEINAAHPFREGNGRTQRAFCELISEKAGYITQWSLVDEKEYIQASISGFLQGDYEAMKSVFENIVTKSSLHLKLVNDDSVKEKITEEKRIGANSQKILEEVVKKYVEMDLKQTAVMQEDQHREIPGYEQRRKEASAKAIAMGKEMTSYALEVIQSPDFQSVIEGNKVIRPEGIAERGGYIAINQRIQEGVYLPEDIKAVVNRINANAEAHKQKQRALSHDQGRGGRSR